MLKVHISQFKKAGDKETSSELPEMLPNSNPPVSPKIFKAMGQASALLYRLDPELIPVLGLVYKDGSFYPTTIQRELSVSDLLKKKKKDTKM